jgi:hypothetical protein
MTDILIKIRTPDFSNSKHTWYNLSCVLATRFYLVYIAKTPSVNVQNTNFSSGFVREIHTARMVLHAKSDLLFTFALRSTYNYISTRGIFFW